MKKLLKVSLLLTTTIFITSCSNSTEPTVKTKPIKIISTNNVDVGATKKQPVINVVDKKELITAVGETLLNNVKESNVNDFQKDVNAKLGIEKYVPVINNDNVAQKLAYNKTPWYVTVGKDGTAHILWYGDYAYEYNDKGIVTQVGINIESFVKKATYGKTPAEANKNINDLYVSTGGKLEGMIPLKIGTKEYDTFIGKNITDIMKK